MKVKTFFIDNEHSHTYYFLSSDSLVVTLADYSKIKNKELSKKLISEDNTVISFLEGDVEMLRNIAMSIIYDHVDFESEDRKAPKKAIEEYVRTRKERFGHTKPYPIPYKQIVQVGNREIAMYTFDREMHIYYEFYELVGWAYENRKDILLIIEEREW